MSLAPFETFLTAIANAIRSKSGGGSVLIPVTDFADRIKLIPRADDVGKVAVYTTEQTTAQMNSAKLVRLNGFPAFETPVGGTAGATKTVYDRFRRDEWQFVDFPPTGTALPNLGYSRLFIVGDKIYGGFQLSSGTGTSIPVINTKTGAVATITGLTAGQYPSFYLVGTKLYMWRGRSIGGSPSHQVIYRINTADDTYISVSLDASRTYTYAALLGNRLYFAWDSSTSTATVLPYIDTTNDTAGTTTGLIARAHHGFFVLGAKLFVLPVNASDTINVITASGGTAPNYTTYTATNIASLPSRIWSNMWSNYAEWCVAGNYVYVASSEASTSLLKIQHSVAANTTTQITDLPSRRHRPMILVGTKVYIGSADATTELYVITNATSATSTLTKITGLPSRTYTTFRLVGTKLYAGSGSTGTTLVVINTTNDTFSEVTGLSSTATSLGEVVLNGTNLYLISSWTTTSMAVINTTNDTVRANIYFPSNSYKVIAEAPVSRANPEGGLYLGPTSSGTAVVEIDYATVNAVPSGGRVDARQIGGLTSRDHSAGFFANEKIWLAGSQTPQTRITVLAKSLLPSHVGSDSSVAPFVYVRY